MPPTSKAGPNWSKSRPFKLFCGNYCNHHNSGGVNYYLALESYKLVSKIFSEKRVKYFEAI